MKATVFLGGGRITSALAAGLRLSGFQGRIIAYDRNSEKLEALRRQSRVEVTCNLGKALEEAEILVFAVRPGSMAALVEEVSATGILPGLCVSLAAGVPLKNLRTWMPAKWVRAMPSPVCRIARGLTALCFHRQVNLRQRQRLCKLFAQVGQVIEVSEAKFDAFTATYSSSHGYHALATLATAAKRSGLDPETALTASAHALADGIAYWRDSGLDLKDLLREAATPGGIAATTIQAMNRAGYMQAVAKGIQAGIRRARKNAKSIQDPRPVRATAHKRGAPQA